jgi:hypothetical protein
MLVTHLDENKEEIRLLRVLPGKDDEVIRCQHIISSLNDRPEYQTVSYVWGDATRTRSISIDGVECDILESLFAALSHIRLLDDEVVLWTDALCINQADAIEKTHQVNIMHRIYRECSNCFIWLGEVNVDGSTGQPAIETAKRAFDVLRVVAEPPADELPPSIAAHEDRVRAGRGLEAMAATSWWSRIWTVQEATLPPRALILWGPLSIPWETAYQAAVNMVANRWPSFVEFGEIFPDGRTNAYTPRVLSIRFARNWERNGTSLLDRIWRFRYRDATDPRDKIYAIMSLMGENALPSVPSCDYSLDAATLFKRVTLDLLRDEHGLKPLIGWRGEKHVTPGLPTWTFDLMRPTEGIQQTARVWTHAHFLYEFTADRGLPMLDTDDLSSEDESLLYVNGLFVDRVAELGEAVIEESEVHSVSRDDLQPNINKWRQIVTDFTATKMEHHGVEGGLREAALGGMRDAFDDLVEGNILSDGLGELNGYEAKDLWSQEMCKNQVLFITDSGRIGLGPPTMQVGDEVWVLSGGRPPFVLRPCDDSVPGGESDMHEFVGDSYVYGIMKGEAVEGREDTQRIVIIR